MSFQRLLEDAADRRVLLRADGGSALAAASAEVHGALAVARQASMWSRVDLTMHPALVNGAFGIETNSRKRCFLYLNSVVASATE